MISAELTLETTRRLESLTCEPVIQATPIHYSIAYTGAKRFLDLVVAVSLIVGILPLLTLVLWPVICLESKGPLFFIQKRTGRNGRVFSIVKFRTMRAGLPSGVMDQDRITPSGRFMRRTHIDELPQLINVLLNQMSLVGPRPHMLRDDRFFESVIPNYAFRQRVKPGITGLAQAMGYSGPTPDYESISHRLKLDHFYVRKASLLLDIRILWRTFRMVFFTGAKENRV